MTDDTVRELARVALAGAFSEALRRLAGAGGVLGERELVGLGLLLRGMADALSALPEGPLEALTAIGVELRDCKGCGVPFLPLGGGGHRKDRLHCSPACRSRAWRRTRQAPDV